MPELPEVETVVKSLASIKNAKIKDAKVYQHQLRIGCIIPNDFEKRIKNTIITDVTRRAKYILIHLDSNEIIIVHLGMSGNLLLKEKNYKPLKHNHVIIKLENNTIVFHDPRRFGLVDLVNDNDIDKYFKDKKMGPDALSEDFNTKYIKKALEKRKTPIKIALLNQEVVAGLGNIYVCEGLFLAGIDPRTESCKINEGNLKKLISALKETLKKAIKAGGTTLKDYKNSDGSPGYFSQELLVYGREKQLCIICKTPIKKIILGGRSTFFCSKCQK